MRTLTIKREKTGVASLAKMKVYIEDRETGGEIIINNIPCRKLGELKNGEEASFEITSQEARVFVIAGNMSKSYCNDMYQLPAGEDNVYLSGKNKFSLITGNAFRFNGEITSEAQELRRKGKAIGTIVMIVAIAIGLIVGFLISYFAFAPKDNNDGPEAEDFYVDGMTITLTDEFKLADDIIGFNACYESSRVVVFVVKEKFTLAQGLEDYTKKEYGELVLDANDIDTEIKEKNGLTYYEYDFENTDMDQTYYYYSVIYKTDDAFWLVQFATPLSNKGKINDDFVEWAKSVKFE